MIPIRDLNQLPPSESQAVIINCGTKWVTTLALLSALRNTTAPVLIINCESADDSRAHFSALAKRCRIAFSWLEWPLRPHPVALDQLFREIASDTVLLIDSDIEIKTPDVYGAMRASLQEAPSAYGAGFPHGPNWLGEHGIKPFTGYYAERMWIPLVLLRTQWVRDALTNGSSFGRRRHHFEFPSHPALSRLLSYRFRIRGLRRLPMWPPSRGGSNRLMHNGRFPAFVEYDTGADLHAALTSGGHPFQALPEALWGDVSHYHGVTRASLAGPVRRLAKALNLVSRDTETEQHHVMSLVKQRLACVYNVVSG